MDTNCAAKASWEGYHEKSTKGSYEGYSRNIAYIEGLKLDPNLAPTTYHIEGINPNSKIFFIGVNIIDSTGKEPFHGNVLIEGKSYSSLNLTY
jgi:hypothetical protein